MAVKENITIIPYTESHRERILTIWEASVRATHNFLKPDDLNEIKELLVNFDFAQLNVFCLQIDHQLEGFIALSGSKIEMLFLSPDVIGSGYGKRLVEFAVTGHNASSVDVNEQNTSAVAFYLKSRFKVFERTATDDHGRDYPVLRMKLEYNA